MSELARSVATLRPRARALGLFEGAASVHVACAPGRLDLMGGIADYSGSLVLQLPLDVDTVVLAAPRGDRLVRVVSEHVGVEPTAAAASPRAHAVDLTAFEACRTQGYGPLRAELHGAGADWFGYVAGILAVLAREHGADLRTGVDVLVSSRVPEGKGVSSSASVEVAAAAALCAALGLRLGDGGGAPFVDPAACRALALACQRVENHVVGAACGVMDQMAVASGHRGQLLRLLCQPAEVEGYVPLPPGLAVWGIDSGVRHAVSGSDYTSVRVGAFMGWRIVADLLGVEVRASASGVEFEHPEFGSYLANVPPSQWRALRARVPETLGGAEFLARYGGTNDPVARVDPARTYAVRQPTAHPIEEHERVRAFAALLAQAPPLARAPSPEVGARLGSLMFRSHASYTACGLGCAATDVLVDAVRAAGSSIGVYGAKITGGGSGGTVAVLGRNDAGEAVRSIAGDRLVLSVAAGDGAPVLRQGEVPW
ncbi:MAG: galactokinase family protein [Planctomycetota bacterium]